MIGINNVINVVYSHVDKGQIKIKRESATPDQIATIAQCLGLVSAKEPSVYIFKNYNYEQRLNRIDTVKNGDVVEIYDRSIVEEDNPKLFEKSRLKAYCIRIKKLITTFEDAINNTSDKDKIAKYNEYLIYLKSLCVLDSVELLSKSINFDTVESTDEGTNEIPDTPIDILSKSYIP